MSRVLGKLPGSFEDRIEWVVDLLMLAMSNGTMAVDTVGDKSIEKETDESAIISKLSYSLETASLRDGNYSYEQELHLKNKVIEDLQAEVAKMRQEMNNMILDKEMQRDEICALKGEARSYRAELEASGLRAKEVEVVGKEVRMRYLECHRRRMGKRIGEVGYANIKSGDRAAHRGRPLADAWLYQDHQRVDPDVYEDLYGISPAAIQEWRDIPEVLEISGFRASLQSEGRLTDRFRTLFDQFLAAIKAYPTSTRLREAFIDDTTLRHQQTELQDCYDEIVHANQYRRPSQ